MKDLQRDSVKNFCSICCKEYDTYIIEGEINIIKNLCQRCLLKMWLHAYNPTGSDEQIFIIGASIERPKLIFIEDL